MHDIHEHQEVRPCGWAVLRTPLLPFDDWHRWTNLAKTMSRGSTGPSDLTKQLVADKEVLRAHLLQLLTPLVIEAIYIASPSLSGVIQEWSRDPDGKKGQLVEPKLVAFFSRMAGRATPFGLFAGFTFVEEGPKTFLRLGPRSQYSRRTRVDARYLYALSDALEANASPRDSISYRSNPTVRDFAGRFRYLEPRHSGSRGFLLYHSVDCDATEALRSTLRLAKSGASRLSLVSALVESGYDFEEADAFIGDSIAGHLLMSEFDPVVTGQDPAMDLVTRLKNHTNFSEVATDLSAVLCTLRQLDSRGLGIGLKDYESLAIKMKAIAAGANIDESKLFHVDLIKPADNAVLGKQVIEEVIRGIRTLHRLASVRNGVLDQFKERFTERFGSREVSLLEALDEEAGVTFDSEEVGAPEPGEDLPGGVPNSPQTLQHRWTPRDAELLRLVADAVRNGQSELRFSEENIRDLDDGVVGPLLPLFSVFVTIVSESNDAVQAGKFQVILSNYSPSAALYGRFCLANEVLQEKVEEMLAIEAANQPEAIYAEIVHVPAGFGLGNVICRPCLRRAEISFFGRSSIDSELQIDVIDLTVSLSEGRFILRSRQLGKEVIPRMSNAHSSLKVPNTPIYKFLCSLALQDLRDGPIWNWGPVFQSLPFLPRLSYGRLIISRARWLFARKELQNLTAPIEATFFANVQNWCKSHQLPRFVLFVQGDQRLMVDLENILSIRMLMKQASKQPAIILEEMLPSVDQLCVKGPEGTFSHELLIPFQTVSQTARLRKVSRAATNDATTTTVRTILPGSDWLYAKVYCSPSVMDRVLIDVISSYVAELESKCIIDRWFYLRYRDPHEHLRLRFHCREASSYASVLGTLSRTFSSFHASGHIWKMQVDTYEREIERYGGPDAVLIAENVFHADSRACLSMLANLKSVESTANRFILGLAGSHALLSDFGFDLTTCLRIAEVARMAFHKEFALTPQQRHEIGENFRGSKDQIISILMSPEKRDIQPIRRRSSEIKEDIANLRQLSEKRNLLRSLPDLAQTFIHMHLNRLFRTAQRRQELVVYDYLCRSYRLLLSRGMRPLDATISSGVTSGPRCHSI